MPRGRSYGGSRSPANGGRGSSGGGDRGPAGEAGAPGSDASVTPESISEALDEVSDTHGAILYRGASEWTVLEPGTSGDMLQTNGVGADPSWETPSGGGGGGDVETLYQNGVAVALPGATTAETDLHTFNIPGGTLANDGDYVEVQTLLFIGTAGAGTRTARLRLGSTMNLGLAVASTNRWLMLTLRIMRSGVDTQTVTFTQTAWGAAAGTPAGLTASESFNVSYLGTEDDGADITVKTTGQVTTAGAAAVTSYWISVRYYPV